MHCNERKDFHCFMPLRSLGLCAVLMMKKRKLLVARRGDLQICFRSDKILQKDSCLNSK